MLFLFLSPSLSSFLDQMKFIINSQKSFVRSAFYILQCCSFNMFISFACKSFFLFFFSLNIFIIYTCTLRSLSLLDSETKFSLWFSAFVGEFISHLISLNKKVKNKKQIFFAPMDFNRFAS